MKGPGRVFALALPAAGAIVLLAPGLFLGRTPLLRDLILYFHPWTEHLVRRVAAGELPLWNPLLYGGASLAGQIHGRLWYPSFPLYLVFPYRFAVLVDLFAHLALAGALAAAFLRRVGSGAAGAAAGAVAFALNGWILAKLEAPMKIGVYTWLPLVLLGFVDVAQGRRRRGAALIALGAALQILVGYPPIAAYAIPAELIAGGAILIGAAARRRSAREAPPAARPRAFPLVGDAGAVVTGLLVGLLLASVALVPFLEEARLSAYWRPQPEEFALARSLPPVHLLGLVFPRFAGLPGMDRYWGGELSVYTAGALYVGLPLFVLALLAPFLARPARGHGAAASPGSRADALADPAASLSFAASAGLLAAALLAALVAFGRYGPLFGVLRDHVGIFSRTRWPSQSLGVVTGALALAAGIGLGAAARRAEKPGFRHGLAAAMSCLAAACALLSFLRPPGGPALGWIRGALVPGQETPFETHAAGFLHGDLLRAAVLSLAAAGILSTHPRRWGWIALVVAADLTLLGRTLVPFTPEPLFSAAPGLGALGGLAAARERTLHVGGAAVLETEIYGSSDPRIFREARRVLLGATPILYGVPAIDGAEPLQSAQNAYLVGAIGRPRFPEDARGRAARLLGVRAILSPSAWDGGDPAPLDSAPDTVGFRLLSDDPVPFAYLVSRAIVIPEDDGQIARMLDPGFDPTREAVVPVEPDGVTLEEEGGGAAEGAPSGDTPGSCRVTRPRAERILVETEGARDALLVVRESYHPGWRAVVDGRDVLPLRANDLFLGVPLPAGRHVVALTFAPVSVWTGRALSIAGLALLAGLLVPRRRRPGA